jgi:CzcA family heavy metal efflux pump
MLRAVITFCLSYRLIVLLLAAGLLVSGLIVARHAPWDVFPEFAPPQIVVQTEAPGLSTEEVEQLVTAPVESAINGVYGLETLRSSSVPGLSVITAIFEEGTEIVSARQMVNERLVEAKRLLPEIAEAPQLTPLKTSVSRLATIGLTSETVSLRDLRTLADWTLRRRLLAIRGIAQVEIFGGEVKQYQVLADPERLWQYNVTLAEVIAAAQSATGFGGAGYVETLSQRLPVRQRTRIETTEDLAAAPVAYRNGAALTLGQVADVRIGSADRHGDATINGKSGVLLILHKQPNVDTLAVTEELERTLDELTVAVPANVTLHRSLFRQATFIERAMRNLNTSILIGCVLVMLILIAFLFQWRTVVINLTAIPLSLLGAVLLLRWFGASLNAMTLGGLAIALGVVVDDAIVDVENVLRRLSENRRLAHPAPVFQVVLEASLEVRSAIVFASFIVILVFLPVFFLEGLAGTLFRSMGYAYAAAILMSLLVALTVTPAMCFVMLPAIGAQGDPPLVRFLKSIYAKLLSVFLQYWRSTIALTVILLLASLATIPWLGGEFLPEFRESNLVLFMVGKPDMSLVETTRVGKLLAERLAKVDGVVSVAQQTGRADLSEDTWGPNVSEIAVVLDDGHKYDQTINGIRATLDEVPGFDFKIKQFLRERIDEVLTGATANIVLRVVGPDLDELRTQAARITAAIRDVKGVKDLGIEQQVDVPQIEVLLRPTDASKYGFSVSELNNTIQTLLRGRTVGQVYEGDQVFDVVVRARPALRSDPTQIGELLVDSPAGEKVPLRSVASIGLIDGPNAINRDGGSRRMLITCNAEGRDLASVMEDIQGHLREPVSRLPVGYHLEYGGEYQARQIAQRRLLLLSAAAMTGIFMMLYLDFRNTRLSLLIMLSVPLACVGGICAVLLAGGDVSLGSLVGLVTVFGIAVRNGILLVSHYEHLQHAEGVEFGQELIIRGAVERLSPILMTASAAGLALLPLVILGNRPGHEIEYPMAIVILGGLISSTFLSLVLLPIFYQRSTRVR